MRNMGNIAGLCLCILLSSCGDSGTSTSQTSSLPLPQSEYTLSTIEKNVARHLLINDIESASDGSEPAFKNILIQLYENPVATTSAKLQQAYEKNEVAGDQQFRKRTLFLKGKVLSIDRGIGEDYFIGLSGGSNMFIHPKANMADGYVDFLSKLSKGDNVALVCVGNGMLIGSALANKCEPLRNSASQRAAKFIDNLTVKASKSKNDSDARNLIVASIALSSLLPSPTTCSAAFTYDPKCMGELETIINKANKNKSPMIANAMKEAAQKANIERTTAPEQSTKP